MNLPHHRRYMSVSRLEPARAKLVAHQMAELADQANAPPLRAAAEALQAAAARASVVIERRRLQREARADGAAMAIDEVMDAAIRFLHGGLSASIDYYARMGHPLTSKMRGFMERHFPTGVGDITAPSYEVELDRIDALVADLEGPSAALVDPLSLADKLIEVKRHVPAYRAALAAHERVTGGDVQSALAEMHLQLCTLVAGALWLFSDDAEQLARVLAPLDDQQDRVAAIMRARRQGRAGPVAEADVADEADALEEELGDGLLPDEDLADEGGAGDGAP